MIFEIRSHQNKPPKILLSAMKLLQSDHDLGFGKMNDYSEVISEKSSRLHTEGNGNDCSSCGTEEL